jgi:hypothetical protein
MDSGRRANMLYDVSSVDMDRQLCFQNPICKDFDIIQQDVYDWFTGVWAIPHTSAILFHTANYDREVCHGIEKC